MEYKKESEKFSFGFGTQKVAGRGDLSSVGNEDSEVWKALLYVGCSVGSFALKKYLRKKSKKK